MLAALPTLPYLLLGRRLLPMVTTKSQVRNPCLPGAAIIHESASSHFGMHDEQERVSPAFAPAITHCLLLPLCR